MITNNKIFITIQYIFLAILVVMAVVPFLLLISSSFTTEQEILKNGYSLFPREITLDAYRYLLSVSDGILRAYLMSIIIAGSGVLTCLVLTILFAYPFQSRIFRERISSPFSCSSPCCSMADWYPPIWFILNCSILRTPSSQ